MGKILKLSKVKKVILHLMVNLINNGQIVLMLIKYIGHLVDFHRGTSTIHAFLDIFTLCKYAIF